ncbi:hypothetical protein [Plantactinospora sp. DSM 117369]
MRRRLVDRLAEVDVGIVGGAADVVSADAEHELVGGVGDRGVLAVGDTDGQAFLPAGKYLGVAAPAGRFGAHCDGRGGVAWAG